MKAASGSANGVDLPRAGILGKASGDTSTLKIDLHGSRHLVKLVKRFAAGDSGGCDTDEGRLMIPGAPLGHDDVFAALKGRPGANRLSFSEDLVIGEYQRGDDEFVLEHHFDIAFSFGLLGHAAE